MWELVYEFVFVPIFIFIGGYIFLRLAGKKAVSEMNSFDLLFVVVMGTIVAEPLVDKEVHRALLYAGAFLVLYIGFSFATMSNKLRWLLVASPTVLIRNGDIDEKALKKVKITINELLSNLRIKGYLNPKDIELAVLEDMGQFSVIPKATARPVETSDIHLVPKPTFIPIPVVMDGQILDHNLKYLKKDREWLRMHLGTHSLSFDDLDKITIALVNQSDTLDIDIVSPKENDQGADSYKPGRDN
ncbi:DUF421 domain-containing protein [Bacillaceae bacterium S4-13-58]